jgi:prepilin-type N-terminal cleavage/methylation domain-containing protein
MRILRTHKGFTLLEVLIALTMLTIGLLGVLGLTTGIIRGNFFSKNVTTATVIAGTRIEDIQRAGYTNANATNFPAGPDTVSMGGVTFSRSTSIADNSPQANMKTISVTVSWNEANAVARSVNLQTIMAQ